MNLDDKQCIKAATGTWPPQRHSGLRADNTLLVNKPNKQLESDYTGLDRSKTTFTRDDPEVRTSPITVQTKK